MSKLYQFYSLSFTLTGLSRNQLKTKDQQTAYFKIFNDNVRTDIIDELFEFHQQLKQAANNNLPVVRRQIISSAKFGAIALNIINLWQSKDWTTANNFHLVVHKDNNQSSNNLDALSTSFCAPA